MHHGCCSYYLNSRIAGAIIGFIFTLIKLPIPAPTVWPGVFGIIGVLSGNQIFNYLFNK
ncbi:XapX domain protein [Citrobacter braakii]|nr:XapX domain protein [Citrobacter braakii]